MNLDQLKKIIPSGDEDWLKALIDETPKWEITTPIRQAMLIGQYAEETNGFTVFVEDLNYSAKKLMEIWPTHFPTLESAALYEHRPETLANFIYADVNRPPNFALGNVGPGDGWLYRGRGPQITGRNNYRACGLAIGIDLESYPELLLRPEYGVRAMCWFWYSHGCNELADKNDFEGVTIATNGGLIDYNQRHKWFGDALTVLIQDV